MIRADLLASRRGTRPLLEPPRLHPEHSRFHGHGAVRKPGVTSSMLEMPEMPAQDSIGWRLWYDQNASFHR